MLLGKLYTLFHKKKNISESKPAKKKLQSSFSQVEEAHMYAKFQLLFEHFQK